MVNVAFTCEKKIDGRGVSASKKEPASTLKSACKEYFHEMREEKEVCTPRERRGSENWRSHQCACPRISSQLFYFSGALRQRFSAEHSLTSHPQRAETSRRTAFAFLQSLPPVIQQQQQQLLSAAPFHHLSLSLSLSLSNLFCLLLT